MKFQKKAINKLTVYSFVTSMEGGNCLKTKLLKGGTSEDTTYHTAFAIGECDWVIKHGSHHDWQVLGKGSTAIPSVSDIEKSRGHAIYFIDKINQLCLMTRRDRKAFKRVGNNQKMTIMKTKKVSLADLKVKSFVTDMEQKQSDTAKGGTGLPITFVGCPGSQGCNPYTMNSNPYCHLD